MNWLRQQRQARGYSIEKLALESGLSTDTVQNIESGQQKPHRSTLQKLADAGITVPDKVEPGIITVEKEPIKIPPSCCQKIELEYHELVSLAAMGVFKRSLNDVR